MSFLAIAILSINLCGFLFDLIFLSNKTTRNRFFKLPVPQNRFNISDFISLPIGILLFVLGFILGISALFKFGTIPSIREKSNLITTGAYRVVRHPIYSGTLISVLGWTILLKSIISIVYFPFLFLLYFLVTFVEERILIEQYGDKYLDYKKKVTKRFIPFIV
ncbi:MAG: methyltransferase family protein [Planctomycetota bacterium]|jgi:protein-S-isoprenylcysteine O-methyltransferase Ste14